MNCWNKMLAVILGICFIILTSGTCYCDNDVKGTEGKKINFNEVINKQIDLLDFSKVQEAYNKLQGNEILNQINFGDGVRIFASGNPKIKSSLLDKIKDYLVNSLFSEVRKNGVIFSKLLLLIVFLAILKNLQDSYKGDASEIAFYACYVLTVILVMQSFKIVYTVGAEALDNMVGFMVAIFPMIIAMIGASGMPTTASVLSPTVIATVSVVNLVMKDVVLPVIFFYTVLNIVNNVSIRVSISNLCKLLKQVCEWGMGILFTIFVAVISIEGVASSSFDGVLGKTGKFALGNFVPVIGGMLSDALDSVLSCTLLIKNSISLFGIILLIVIISIPLVKLICLILMYKLGAAISQPIADKRIVSVLSDVGDAVSLIFVSVLSAAFVFIIALAIIISIGSSGIGRM